MRWYHMIGGLALVLLLTMIGLPGLSYAQGAGGLADFRDKSSYSVEDLAQALFAEGVFFPQRRRVREKSTHYGTLYLKQDLSGGSSYCIHQSPTRKVPYYGSTSCHH